MTDRRHMRAGLAAVTACLLVLAACADQQAAVPDKAVGAVEPVTLTMANITGRLDYEPAVQYFVDQVEELSGGAVRIEVIDDWGVGDDVDQQVVRAVASDEVDLAWVGTRVFETMGVDGFRALSAPMLIDSYPLQQAVIASDIPGEMLSELDQVGVTGIAVLADSLGKPFAVEQPLLSPRDYDGINFLAYHATTYIEAIRALDAGHVAGDRTALLTTGDIQGFELNLSHYSLNAIEQLAPYVTANVSLWARPVAIIGNPDVLGGLTDGQREWVLQAGAAAAERSTDLVSEETDLVAQLCERGVRFGAASADDIEAMRAAVAPVYATLEQDPQTAEFIARIREFKETTDPGPALAVPADCTGRSPLATSETAGTVAAGDEVVALDGTYRWTLTLEEALESGAVSEDEDFPWVMTVTLDDGVWAMRWETPNEQGVECDTDDCTFTVDGDRIAFDWGGAVLEFTFTAAEDGSIQLQPIGAMNVGDRFVWSTKLWQRIG